MNKIESKVRTIIANVLDVDYAVVKPEASFTNDLCADSIDTIELIMEFEKEFCISIPDDKAEKIGTVGDAIYYIESHLESSHAFTNSCRAQIGLTNTPANKVITGLKN